MTVIGHGVDLCTSTTRPASPNVGAIIFETDTMSYRWYTGSAWEGIIPVGTTQSFAGTTAPTGWLLCFGQSLNATANPQYAALFNALGTTYGGTGITAFNVPDLRGRAPHGKDDMGGSAASRITSGASGITGNTLGATGGTETHTLTTTQTPAHNHSVTDPGHTHANPSGSLGFVLYNASTGSASGASGGSPLYIGSATASATTGISTQNTGGGGAHNNMPPTIITNYIIKY